MYTIREATLEDVEGISRVHVETWRHAYRGIVPAEHLAGLSVERSAERNRAMFTTQRLPGAFCLVAVEESGEIIGFCFAGPERESDPEYTAEVYGIYVHPQWHRQGAGRALIREAVMRLQALGFHNLIIWCLAGNPWRTFYEALGGTVVRQKYITIGGVDLSEVGFGWQNLGECTMQKPDVP